MNTIKPSGFFLVVIEKDGDSGICSLNKPDLCKTGTKIKFLVFCFQKVSAFEEQCSSNKSLDFPFLARGRISSRHVF
jgi:hypothetical protein